MLIFLDRERGFQGDFELRAALGEKPIAAPIANQGTPLHDQYLGNGEVVFEKLNRIRSSLQHLAFELNVDNRVGSRQRYPVACLGNC